ncbi:N-acetylmuramoyl-L-alanine amidase [Roseovarius sp. A21]|uniref:N-acetylmuramoyl-L-alanine amidase n=1 Tax=Roseovarius bejariae TaxID=2576383 RepID=A0A844D403_9RHOB|nr:N-acetylmuramoyl-L-alanine amidase [Roseovarius bejariae]MRU16583.1 N-acetylmuramoyl-L-alanine amidase [Roseovarius bejariae]
MVVLHYTAMETAGAALDRLCDPAAEVSAHYLICEKGQVFALVPEDRRAWHAGAGGWGAVRDVNSRSIGIELANTGTHPFPEPQITTLVALMRGVMQRWDIPPERIIGHSDMAPLRKADPGRRFDWGRLAREGLGVWPKLGRTPGDFLQDAQVFGYVASGDVGQKAILDAFRQRFRPWAEGPLCDTDRALMADLAARFPVDRVGPNA